jgi:hypothetical protein
LNLPIPHFSRTTINQRMPLLPFRGTLERTEQPLVGCRDSQQDALTGLRSMGGERSSTTRRRLAGKICCSCHAPLSYDPSHQNKEQYCSRCNPTPHTVYRYFMLYGSLWNCQFLEPDLKTSLPRKLNFSAVYRPLQEGWTPMREHGCQHGSGPTTAHRLRGQGYWGCRSSQSAG